MGFRLATDAASGRALLVADDGAVDLERATNGRFEADPMAAIARFAELQRVGDELANATPDAPFDPTTVGPCVPRPVQIFGVGLNYKDHAAESGMALPSVPMIFTKFQSSLAGPTADIPIVSGMVDWEVELVVVIGVGGRDIPRDRGWDHVAGLTVGQDVSDRGVQFATNPAQFSMGKSFRNFSPIGPALVSLDLVSDRDALALTCDVDSTREQDGNTRDLIFDVPALVAYLSSICELLPGDLIFTGTPAGVGVGKGRFLQVGQTVVSTIDGVGTLTNHCVAP